MPDSDVHPTINNGIVASVRNGQNVENGENIRIRSVRVNFIMKQTNHLKNNRIIDKKTEKPFSLHATQSSKTASSMRPQCVHNAAPMRPNVP